MSNKVLLITRAIAGGGAANACLRLYEALSLVGAEVRLLALERPHKLSEGLRHDPNIRFLSDKTQYQFRAKAYKLLERLELLWYKGGSKLGLWAYSTGTFGFDLSEDEWVQWADVLHLHWVSHGMLSRKGLETLANLGKPLVWTLHDLWAVTGLAHLPELYPRHKLSFSGDYAERKALSKGANVPEEIAQKFIYSRQHYHLPKAVSLLGVSPFVSELAGGLSPNHKQSIRTLATPLDLSAYTLEEQPQQHLDFYQDDRFYILIAAARLDEPVKGFHYLKPIMQALEAEDASLAQRITFLLAGAIKDRTCLEGLDLDYIELGRVGNAETMRQLYQVASLTLSLSYFETFGLTLLESIAMGTPAVSFDCGGVRDIIQNGVNGSILVGREPKAMAKAILRQFRSREPKEERQVRCRASVQAFDYPTIAQKYLSFYQELCHLQAQNL